MRDIVKVINELKPYIDNEVVLNEMQGIVYDSCYVVPDDSRLWEELGLLLNYYYPAPLKNDDQIKIVSIFTNMSEEDVKKNFC